MIVMKDKVYERLGRFIHEEYGITMPSGKKFTLQAKMKILIVDDDFNSRRLW